MVVVGLFIGAMYAIALSDAEGELSRKVPFWALAPVPIAAGVATLVVGLRAALPGTGPTG